MIRRLILLVTILLMASMPQAKPEQTQEKQEVAFKNVVPIAITTKSLSRGKEPIEKRIMECSGYTDGKESTGKTPAHKAYGKTASGTKTKEWYTVAAGPELPFGTKVYIPYFKDKPNRGIFVVEDRGVGNGHLDVYFGDPAIDKTAVPRAREFGRRQLEVWVMKS